jgi:hypothetical protein
MVAHEPLELGTCHRLSVQHERLYAHHRLAGQRVERAELSARDQDHGGVALLTRAARLCDERQRDQESEHQPQGGRHCDQ